ncbi:glycoside hydrolase family 18 protein [Neurospora crassa]|uniref:chitinase n=1 Tax=Neurospora crassa (strain ATCC 24698 / 74-OR23-1A / CBS 708.71 / DSM 1257 / FGSC 987) TaxID=367110 RepID=Q7S062_NEUCR|nr:chitinase 1 [Neurospora crassa OR74A]EAA28688.2 chitinase 1 [Neurospora crassa OR74A]KHE81915.1 glycoside hydrolase family 18 protein [Neurospora crassa]|eukprot:XP_957924.2 chitinase 1 [Neurospora crassa OR74A]
MLWSGSSSDKQTTLSPSSPFAPYTTTTSLRHLRSFIRSFVMMFSIKAAALAVLSFSSFLVDAAPAPMCPGTNVTSTSADTNVTVPDRADSSGYKNVVYFTNWGIYGRNYQAADLPADKITHVLYSFANLKEDGTVFSSDTWSDTDKRYPTDSWNDNGTNVYGCVKQLYLLKKANRNVRVLLSIGGWTYSQTSPSRFALTASTAESRTKFATSALALVKDWGFDGIDIDWEYPASETEAQNFLLLLKEIRSQMDKYAAAHADGYHFLLTMAASAGPSKYGVLESSMKEIGETLDFMNLMAYDYAGAWDKKAGHQANLYPDEKNPDTTPFSTDRAVTDYIKFGIPSNKIVLGMPLYGRAFASTDGPGTAYSGVGEGSWEKGIWDYKVLPKSGAKVFLDEKVGASWSYDETNKVMVSYDTPEMVKQKVSYIKEKGLGGAMYWEASGDRTDKDSLMTVVKDGLGTLDSEKNLLEYPDSQYDNMKKGMSS